MKKFSIRTVEDLQAQLSNATTQEQLEAVFNSAMLKVLRTHIGNLAGDKSYDKATRTKIIEILIEWTLEDIAERKEVENFKKLSFEEQISYLQSENCKDYFITLMDYTKMKEFVCKVYPERVEQIKNSKYIHLWFERAIGKSSDLENLSNYSYAADKRITRRNIQRIKQCESEREITELLSTGNQDTLAMIIDTLGIRGNSLKNCVEQLKKVI